MSLHINPLIWYAPPKTLLLYRNRDRSKTSSHSRKRKLHMMRKIIYLLILSVASSVNAQIIKWQNGATISSLHGKGDANIFSKNQSNYATSFGIIYCENTFFNLNSNIGCTHLGGKSEQLSWHEDGTVITDGQVSPEWKYLFANTTFRLQMPFGSSMDAVYVGVGPQLNIVIGDIESEGPTDYKCSGKRMGLGGLFEVGLTQNFNGIFFDLNVSYLHSFTPTATFANTNLYSRSWNIGLSIGYKL